MKKLLSLLTLLVPLAGFSQVTNKSVVAHTNGTLVWPTNLWGANTGAIVAAISPHFGAAGGGATNAITTVQSNGVTRVTSAITQNFANGSDIVNIVETNSGGVATVTPKVIGASGTGGGLVRSTSPAITAGTNKTSLNYDWLSGTLLWANDDGDLTGAVVGPNLDFDAGTLSLDTNIVVDTVTANTINTDRLNIAFLTVTNPPGATNYSYAADRVISCHENISATFTNTITGAMNLLLTNLTAHTSGRVTLPSDGSIRTISLFAPVTIVALQTNATMEVAGTVVTTASKTTMVCWDVDIGTDGVTKKIYTWAVTQP